MRAQPHALLLALIAGIVSALGFAPLDFWPATLGGIAALLWLVKRVPSRKRAMLIGWNFGLGHFIVSLNWIAGSFRYQDTMPVWLGWIAVALLSCFLAVFPAIASLLAWQLRDRRIGYALAFAAAWIVTEYARATLFTGFAWNPIGVAMVPTSISGLAALIGTYGLSALVVLIAATIADRDRLIAAPIMFGLCYGAGWGVTALLGTPAARPITLRVVQPNIGQSTKYDPTQDEANFAKLATLTGPPSVSPRLILWPEAATPWFLEEEAWARQRVASLLGPNDLLITGGDRLIYDRNGKLVGAHNSAMLVTPDARIAATYDKAHLVPYGEYLPMRPLLSAIGLNRLVPGDMDFAPGPGPRSITVDGIGKVGIQICYEMIFSGHVIDRANRPMFLFNPTNDAWFGSWGPPQHLAQARLRAIEEGMPIVRATPTGISAVIDARGRIVASVPLGKPGFLNTLLPGPVAPTPFARYGNAIPLVLALIMAMLAVALTRRARYEPRT